MAKTPIEAIRDFSRLRDSKKKSHRDFIPKNMKKTTYIFNEYISQKHKQKRYVQFVICRISSVELKTNSMKNFLYFHFLLFLFPTRLSPFFSTWILFKSSILSPNRPLQCIGNGHIFFRFYFSVKTKSGDYRIRI